MKHNIPLQTPIAFENDHSRVCYTVDYQTLHVCSLDCNMDHDHYEEPYMSIIDRDGLSVFINTNSIMKIKEEKNEH